MNVQVGSDVYICDHPWYLSEDQFNFSQSHQSYLFYESIELFSPLILFSILFNELTIIVSVHLN